MNPGPVEEQPVLLTNEELSSATLILFKLKHFSILCVWACVCGVERREDSSVQFSSSMLMWLQDASQVVTFVCMHVISGATLSALLKLFF